MSKVTFSLCKGKKSESPSWVPLTRGTAKAKIEKLFCETEKRQEEAKLVDAIHQWQLMSSQLNLRSTNCGSILQWRMKRKQKCAGNKPDTIIKWALERGKFKTKSSLRVEKAERNERSIQRTQGWLDQAMNPSNPPFESEARPGRDLDATPQKANRTLHEIVYFDDPSQYLWGK